MKYVCCQNCKYPELIMSLEGKNGLKSICKSCGKTNMHDSMHKAGKVLVQELKQTGGKLGGADIANAGAEDDDDETGDVFMGSGAAPSKKEEVEDDFSDLDADLTMDSRRISK